MKLLRHIPFLKEVLRYSLTAFGGPQGHIGMMMRSFVEKRKDITENELMDYLSFCQMLPGPSSSQTIALIGYKRGGIKLGVLTLLVWIIPAAFLMSVLSFVVKYIDATYLQNNIFQFIQPMAVGFIIYAALRAMKISLKSKAGWIIMLFGALAIVIIRDPIIFPICIITGGLITNFTNNEFPAHDTSKFKIHWKRLGWFVLIYVVAGALSEIAIAQDWNNKLPFNLFVNFYGFGSIVFGGGHALIPLLQHQFTAGPDALMTAENFTTGIGLVHAIPGPVFSLCSFVGGLCMDSDPTNQILGCIVATVGVFLPGALILFFLFPLYQNLKQYRVIFRALEGIHTVIIGILWGSAINLYLDLMHEKFGDAMTLDFGFLLVIASTALTLNFTKIPAPFIVVFWLLLGILF